MPEQRKQIKIQTPRNKESIRSREDLMSFANFLALSRSPLTPPFFSTPCQSLSPSYPSPSSTSSLSSSSSTLKPINGQIAGYLNYTFDFLLIQINLNNFFKENDVEDQRSIIGSNSGTKKSLSPFQGSFLSLLSNTGNRSLELICSNYKNNTINCIDKIEVYSMDDPYLGRLFGKRYKSKKKLGHGTYGVVYLVEDM